MVLTNSTKQMRTTKGTFNAVLSRVQIDGNSCADLEGGQKEEGSGNLQENQSSSVYIVKLLNICIGPPFPRPWKTFLDLCMEAISFCKKVSHLRMLIHILSRFFSGLHRKDPKSWDLHVHV